jgi:S-(hydroxymethyl)glutathione dehydrogenase/alcohol dehydrogenase
MELSVPKLQYGQVLVKVDYSGICGAQLKEIRGEKMNAGFLPHLLGHEGCGHVIETGPGVTKVKAGNRVVMHWRKGSGIEAANPEYRYGSGKKSIVRAGKITTFNTFSVCSENRLTSVPFYAHSTFCTLLGCSLSTAIGTLEQEANLRPGESLLVLGCGGLGLATIIAADLRGAGTIVAVDKFKYKSWIAKQCGATSFIEFQRLFSPDSITKDLRFDVVIETSGDPRAFQAGLLALAASGRMILVGQTKPGQSLKIPDGYAMFEGDGKMIKATQGGGFQPHLDILRYLHVDARLNYNVLISHRLGFQKINDAINLAQNGQAGRVLIEF